MARVIEVEATKEQVLAFIVDCERVEATFKGSTPTEATREALKEVKARWEPLANGPGPRLSGAGLYGHFLEAIQRLPRLNQPRGEWFYALEDARSTAAYAASMPPDSE